MKRTTVYLSEEESDGLRRLAASSGTSQANLIREGIRKVLRGKQRRKFHSMGQGDSGGMSAEMTEQDSRDLYRKKLGFS